MDSLADNFDPIMNDSWSTFGFKLKLLTTPEEFLQTWSYIINVKNECLSQIYLSSFYFKFYDAEGFEIDVQSTRFNQVGLPPLESRELKGQFSLRRSVLNQVSSFKLVSERVEIHRRPSSGQRLSKDELWAMLLGAIDRAIEDEIGEFKTRLKRAGLVDQAESAKLNIKELLRRSYFGKNDFSEQVEEILDPTTRLSPEEKLLHDLFNNSIIGRP